MIERFVYFFLISFTFQNNLFAQDNMIGLYVFKGESGYEEKIELNESGYFLYALNSNLSKFKVSGNWQIMDSILVLNSCFPKDKLLVNESFDKRTKGTRINVSDSREYPITYHIQMITINGDTLSFRDQFLETHVKEKILSFIIMDRKGLISPRYSRKNFNSNLFSVLFETVRVFENEKWLIVNSKEIKPKNMGGESQNYLLVRD